MEAQQDEVTVHYSSGIPSKNLEEYDLMKDILMVSPKNNARLLHLAVLPSQ
jgi:hypothetical protein